MLFRPIRIFIFLGITFMAGILYEKRNDSDSCASRGGEMNKGLCELKK